MSGQVVTDKAKTLAFQVAGSVDSEIDLLKATRTKLKLGK